MHGILSPSHSPRSAKIKVSCQEQHVNAWELADTRIWYSVKRGGKTRIIFGKTSFVRRRNPLAHENFAFVSKTTLHKTNVTKPRWRKTKNIQMNFSLPPPFSLVELYRGKCPLGVPEENEPDRYHSISSKTSPTKIGKCNQEAYPPLRNVLKKFRWEAKWCSSFRRAFWDSIKRYCMPLLKFGMD